MSAGERKVEFAFVEGKLFTADDFTEEMRYRIDPGQVQCAQCHARVHFVRAYTQKQSGKDVRAHFKHNAQDVDAQTYERNHSPETEKHFQLKHWIAHNFKTLVFRAKCCDSGLRREYTFPAAFEAVVEETIAGTRLRPDVTFKSQDGTIIAFIEVFITHPRDDWVTLKQKAPLNFQVKDQKLVSTISAHTQYQCDECALRAKLERMRLKQLIFDQFKTLTLSSKCCSSSKFFSPFTFDHAAFAVQDFALQEMVADVAFFAKDGQLLGAVQVADEDTALALRSCRSVPLIFCIRDETFKSSIFTSELETCQSCNDEQRVRQEKARQAQEERIAQEEHAANILRQEREEHRAREEQAANVLRQKHQKRRAQQEQEALEFKDELVRACPVAAPKPQFDPRPKANKAMVRCSFCTMAFCVDTPGKLCPTCGLYTVEACARCPQNPKECFTHLPHVCMSACSVACKYAPRGSKKAKNF